jgi:tetratricopeptide (TPR) repeat protein
MLLVPFAIPVWVLYGAGAAVAVILVLILWWRLGPGPRRRRNFRHAQQRLKQGQWREALQLVQQMQSGRVPVAWQGRLSKVEGECHRAGMTAAVRDKQFDAALDHALKAAHRLKRTDAEARLEVGEAMLGEVRRLFSSTGNTAPIHELVGRILRVQPNNLEAYFWQGLCQIRDGQIDEAMASLHIARAGIDKTPGADVQPLDVKKAFIDPSLYLGALHLRQGQAKESLRYLTEANRLDGNCPFVTWQLGTAMLAAGGDAQLAVRALQRTFGPRGFPLWKDQPHRAWSEGFPETRSYVRRLAVKHAYTCPLWGSDLQQILRQGSVTLASGLYRLGNYREASEIFGKLLQEGAPSAGVLRGYGLALARLGQYDEAFKHLRTAHELEEPKDRLTAGYLALCGAKGKASVEDKPRNVAWAVRLVSQFTAPGDAEWATLVNAIFAEARTLNLPIDADDQLYLCEHLLSVRAADPQAAEAFHFLQATFPGVMHREYAWLYCRAAQLHGITGPQALDLFAVTFADPAAAREFFDKHSWKFDDVEIAYLERAAALAPGAFPEPLGPAYAPRGESLLLERSRQLEHARQGDAALAVAETLLKLAPRSARAHDRLAFLAYQRGDVEQSLHVLESWSSHHPSDPLPLVRQAILHQHFGEPERCMAKIQSALDLCHGPERADLAFLGARMLLKISAGAKGSPPDQVQAEVLRNAGKLLEEGLQYDPQHVQGLWLLAAVRSQLGDKAGLAQQAAAMNRDDVPDPRYHFLAGICYLAADNYPAVIDACSRTRASWEKLYPKSDAKAQPMSLALESNYLAGWAQIMQTNVSAATDLLRLPASKPDHPSASHARALLGTLAFVNGSADEAIKWWQSVDPKKRAAWKLNETLAGTMFLGALEAYHAGAYIKAADKLREAGKLGCRDRRLGPLLSLCLVKAGQHYLYNPLEVISG